MSLYALFNNIACFMLVAYNMLQFKRKKEILGGVSRSAIKHFEEKNQKGISKLLSAAGFWVVIEVLIISVVQYIGVGFLNTIVGYLLNTGANYFGMILFAPLFVVLFCVLWKIDPLAQMDLITPAYPLALFFSKIACHFTGCCRGIRWIYGFFNPTSRLIEFPIQLLEAIVALLLFVVLFSCRNKFKKGRLFPTYLMVYSALRFFTEFLRVEPEVFMGLKTYHILCIVGVVIGALEYLAVCKYDTYVKNKNNVIPIDVET